MSCMNTITTSCMVDVTDTEQVEVIYDDFNGTLAGGDS